MNQLTRTYKENLRCRSGSQGQEKDDEIKGKGNSVNYKYRMHDPRLGRFFAADPLSASYPHNSPYAFSENSTIAFVELEGLEKVYYKNSLTGKSGSFSISGVNSDDIEEKFNSLGFNYDSDWFEYGD